MATDCYVLTAAEEECVRYHSQLFSVRRSALFVKLYQLLTNVFHTLISMGDEMSLVSDREGVALQSFVTVHR